jgi:flagellar hook assembly protein FlgD
VFIVRRTLLTIQGILVISAWAALAVWAGSAVLFINFPSISPNGDGVQDEMTVTAKLSTAVDRLIITVEDKISPAVYDTLMLEAPADTGDHAVVWEGTDWTGAVLPEGEYDLILRETTGASSDSILRTVVIDLTSPLVNIARIEPGVFSPGWPDTSASVNVYFNITGWEAGAAVRMMVRNPSGDETTDPVDVQGDGDWIAEWKPVTAETGFNVITITAADEAGNSDADSGSVYVDSDGPELEIITEIPASTPEAPHEIIGRTFDRAGISWIECSWTGPDLIESARIQPDSTWLDADTLYWSVDTPDTANGDAGYVEGGYLMKVFVKDAFGNQSDKQISFMLDRTAPTVPRIADPPERMIQSQLNLYIDYASGTDTLNVYWQAGGTVVSESFITLGRPPEDPFELTLAEGKNEFWATATDNAGNTSGPSNTVRTTFDPTTGITYPEVFRGPNTIQVVSAETALSVTLEIYDMRGERIRRFSVPGPGTNFDIAWDLTNDDGEMVKNGPCLFVIVIETAGSRIVDKAFIAVVR